MAGFWDDEPQRPVARFDGSLCYFHGSHMGGGNVCRQCFWTYRQHLFNAEREVERLREREAWWRELWNLRGLDPRPIAQKFPHNKRAADLRRLLGLEE